MSARLSQLENANCRVFLFNHGFDYDYEHEARMEPFSIHYLLFTIH